MTGLPADAIRDLAHRYATTRPAAIFCNAGISHQLNAFATYRALTFLAAITGNIGVPGGGCNFMHNTWPGDLQLPPPVGEAPSPSAPALPVGPDYFAQAILTGQPYPLRAVVTAGNPLMSSANSHKVREAFRQPEFYVYTGLFMEESAYYADLVLPVCSGFEMETVYMRRDDRAIRWQAQVVPRVGMSKPDWEIWIELAQVMARQDSRQAELWKARVDGSPARCSCGKASGRMSFSFPTHLVKPSLSETKWIRHAMRRQTSWLTMRSTTTCPGNRPTSALPAG